MILNLTKKNFVIIVSKLFAGDLESIIELENLYDMKFASSNFNIQISTPQITSDPFINEQDIIKKSNKRSKVYKVFVYPKNLASINTYVSKKKPTTTSLNFTNLNYTSVQQLSVLR